MKKELIVLAALIYLLNSCLFAQTEPKHQNIFDEALVQPRMRVIIDNDFSGDPDGLFALVHHLLSPSVDIRAIIGSHLNAGNGFDTSKFVAVNARKKVEEVLKIMNLVKAYPTYEGSNVSLEKDNVPQKSAGANAIIKEAMRDDTKLPLYVVCGAGLTNIASAYLLEPEIAKRLTLIWIGGPEYTEIATPPPGYSSLEYNLGIDIKAAQVIFNKSSIPIWQVPRSTYRQVLFPYSSLLAKIKTEGEIGNYLTSTLENVMKKALEWHINIGETYILGDSPLVLLTALQSSFEADPSSSNYILRPSPLINNQGLYEVNNSGRNIRVYNKVDVPLIFEDFLSKLQLYNQKRSSK